jgi:hypothetical protein
MPSRKSKRITKLVNLALLKTREKNNCKMPTVIYQAFLRTHAYGRNQTLAGNSAEAAT